MSANTSAAKVKDNGSVLNLETGNDELNNTKITVKSALIFTPQLAIHLSQITFNTFTARKIK
jgi:hypothetical protein